MGLFIDIYNTVAKFFRPQEEQGDASKSVATNRLKLVLMQDRTNLTPKILEQMRSELIDLLSRYVEMDKELLELNFEQEGDQVALMLSIPVIRAKDEDEIEIAMKEREAKSSNKESEDGESEGSEDSDNSDEEIEIETELDIEEVEVEEVSENEENENVEKAPKTKAKTKVSKPKEIKNSSEETNEQIEEQTANVEG